MSVIAQRPGWDRAAFETAILDSGFFLTYLSHNYIMWGELQLVRRLKAMIGH